MQGRVPYKCYIFLDFGERKLSFVLGERFQVHSDDPTNQLFYVCTKPDINALECRTEDPRRGWQLLSTMIFDEDGFTEVKTNLKIGAKEGEGVSGTKRYVRIEMEAADENEEYLDKLAYDGDEYEDEYDEYYDDDYYEEELELQGWE